MGSTHHHAEPCPVSDHQAADAAVSSCFNTTVQIIRPATLA
jgi:hypothetical protein